MKKTTLTLIGLILFSLLNNLFAETCNINWYCGDCADDNGWQWQEVASYDETIEEDFFHMSYAGLGFSKDFIDMKSQPVGILHYKTDTVPDFLNCSGTMISKDLFLTAAHCITNPAKGRVVQGVVFEYQKDQNGDVVSEEYFQVADDGIKNSGVVAWGFGRWNYNRYIMKQREYMADYAIIRLKPNTYDKTTTVNGETSKISTTVYPGEMYGITRMNTESVDEGQPVMIIGHPGHTSVNDFPRDHGEIFSELSYNGKAKKVDVGNTLEYRFLRSRYKNFWGYKPMERTKTLLIENLDIYPSNSGSGILNNTGEIIGILKWSFCFGERMVASNGETHWITPAFVIENDLRLHYDTILDEIYVQ